MRQHQTQTEGILHFNWLVIINIINMIKDQDPGMPR